MLVEYFVQRYAGRMGKDIRSIDKKTLDLLQFYGWPGNIRELQNVIERSVILSSGDALAGSGSVGHLAAGGGDYGWPRGASKVRTSTATVNASAGEQKQGDVDMKFGLDEMRRYCRLRTCLTEIQDR